VPRRNSKAGRRPPGPRPVPSHWQATSEPVGRISRDRDESRPTRGASSSYAAADPKLVTHKRNGEATPMAADNEPQVRRSLGRPRIYVPTPDLDWRPAA
jgi:hypothetical protein